MRQCPTESEYSLTTWNAKRAQGNIRTIGTVAFTSGQSTPGEWPNIRAWLNSPEGTPRSGNSKYLEKRLSEMNDASARRWIEAESPIHVPASGED